MDLMKFFTVSKTLQFKEGEVLIMGENVNITPTSIFADFQKSLIANIGFEKAYDSLYETAKKVSIDYNKKFSKKRGFKSKRDLAEWQIKLITLAGWGTWSFKSLDIEKQTATIHIKDSPFSQIYGKCNYPIDIIPLGLAAGGAVTTLGEGVDAIETKCTSMGESHCEIKIAPKKEIDSLKYLLWKKWKLI